MDATQTDVPNLGNAELVQLHIRVIALENLLITLLADASEQRLAQAREMATYISPRPGFTPHPLTLGAAAEMRHLVGRAAYFRDTPLQHDSTLLSSPNSSNPPVQ